MRWGYPVKSAWRIGAKATARFRMLPDIVIIGAQKSGTTSLYNYLIRHPHVARSTRTEVHFFDDHFSKGERWYRGHFPTRSYGRIRQLASGRRVYTIESSPSYLFHPLAAERASGTLPNARYVAVLRNPVDRAYSHYRMERRRGYEGLSFEGALEAEGRRTEGEFERLRTGQIAYSHAFKHFSYVARGRYADQLRRWFRHVDRDRVLVLCAERFWEEPAETFPRMTDFLDLPRWTPSTFKSYGSSTYEPMAESVRRELVELFREPNEDLERLLGRTFPWGA